MKITKEQALDILNRIKKRAQHPDIGLTACIQQRNNCTYSYDLFKFVVNLHDDEEKIVNRLIEISDYPHTVAMLETGEGFDWFSANKHKLFADLPDVESVKWVEKHIFND